MKVFKTIILSLLIIIFLSITSIFSQQIIKYNKKLKNDSVPYKEDEVIVKFKDSLNSFQINNINKNYNTSIKNFSKKDSNIKLIKFDKKTSIENIINKYKNDPDVEFVQPNYIYSIFNIQPNDQYFNIQWGLKNIGQSIPPDYIAGKPDSDIDAFETTSDNDDAWDINTGSSSIIVAVIDTGVDYLHPDLLNNLWTNGSGKYGYDFIDNDSDPMDLEGHGSIVAGIIGATANNSIGISGIAWNVKIMSVRGLDEYGTGTTFTLSESINYAVTNGAHIINASWGGTANDAILRNAIENAGIKKVLFVTSAGNGGADVIGDDNTINPQYPANYHLPPYNFNNVISVAASNQIDNLAPFSNYGETSVHLCAPGINIISTVPVYSIVISKIKQNKELYIYSIFSLILLFPALFFKKRKKYFYKKILLIISILFILFMTVKCQPPVIEESKDSSSNDDDDDSKPPEIKWVLTGHSYAVSSGTSVATPFITGIAVLMKTKNNTLTPSQIISLLSNPLYSEDLSGTSALNNKVISDGRINAKKVLDAVVPSL